MNIIDLKSKDINMAGGASAFFRTKVNFNNASIPIVKRPSSAIILNDEGSQRSIVWSPYGYVKHIFPEEELERIKTFTNNQVLVYPLMLRNYDRQIFQKTPFTVVYKANYPN